MTATPADRVSTVEPLARTWSWAIGLRKLLGNPSFVFGAVTIVAGAVVAGTAPWIAPYDPTHAFTEAAREPPSGRFWLGTDELGRDVLSRIIYGSRVSARIIVVSVGLAALVGSFLGLVSGFVGRFADTAIMRWMDVLLAFPAILLAIAVVAILGPGLGNTMLAIAVAVVPVYARTVRASVLSAVASDYVKAAVVVGVSKPVVMVRHVLPNVLTPVIVISTVNAGVTLLIAAGLSYLGLGAQPPTPEWGSMLSNARAYLPDAWWMATFPGLAIAVTVLAFNLLGDVLRDALDPRFFSE